MSSSLLLRQRSSTYRKIRGAAQRFLASRFICIRARPAIESGIGWRIRFLIVCAMPLVALLARTSEAQTTTALSVTVGGTGVTSVPAQTAVVLTATVASGATAVSVGQVNFCDATAAYCTGIHVLGTSQITGAGTAIFRLVPSPGTHSYKAVFLGTHIFARSTSAAAPLLVIAATGPVSTTVGIQSSGSQGAYSLLGTVATNGLASPTGAVSFLDTTNANYELGTATLGPTGSNGISFRTTYSFPTPRKLNDSLAGCGIVSGDFNNDGIPDLIVANPATSTLSVLLGKGDGTFTVQNIAEPAGYRAASLQTGDFNSDGNLDFVLALGEDGYAVYLGNGDGSFQLGQVRPTTDGAGTLRFVTGDFNGDGIPDLVLQSSIYNVPNSNFFETFLGNGDGTFTKVSVTTPIDVIYGVVAADFNGDGKLDIAYSGAFNHGISILLGNGDGTFTTGTTVQPSIAFDALAVADLNGDGNVDLVATDQTNNATTVYLGRGDGSFTVLPNDPNLQQFSDSIVLADFNGDGIPDLVLPYGGNTSVFLGKGDGTFVPDTFSPTTADFDFFGLATADFNGDGQSDIAAVLLDNNDANDRVDILLSQAPNTAAGYIYNISPVGTGYHYIDVTYPGDANNVGGTSATIPLLAEQVPTTLTLTASPSGGSSPGQPVTLTATLNQFFAQNHYASGPVKFTSGATNLGSMNVANGVATLTTTALPLGTDNLKAAYAGDINFIASTSAIVPYPLTPPIAPTVTVSLVSATIGTTTPVTVTATETGASGAATGGVVTFSVVAPATGSFSPASCTLSSAGNCTTSYIPTGTLAVGAYPNTISVSFSAVGSYAPATATNALFIPDVENVLVSFTGSTGAAPGAQLYSGGNLIQASDGNFYGTAPTGGANANCTLGSCGTLFKVSANGTYTLLHSFSSATTDGANPNVGLVQGTDGNLYGTTSYGGAYGNGTVFQISLQGAFKVLHSFANGTSDGSGPLGGLVQGTDGNFYGMSYGGGVNARGTIFSISSSGTFMLLHSLIDSDGLGPNAGLVQGTDGNFYGTTSEFGGLCNNPQTCGTVFGITPTGAFTVVYQFSATTVGWEPNAGLVQGADGNFYGTTAAGGANANGTVFKLSSGGTLTLLHSFSSALEGRTPEGQLVEGSDGNFYGTNYFGGTNANGTLFRVNSAGTFTPLYSFSGAATDGHAPFSGMVQGADGDFYGLTTSGGANADGTIYKLFPTPALAGPVNLSTPFTSTVNPGQTFVLRYAVANATSDTMQQCFATNNAGDTTGWVGIKTAAVAALAANLTAPATPGTYIYTLTCGGIETSQLNLTVTPAAVTPTVTVSAVTAPFGSTTPVIVEASESGASGSAVGGVVTFSVVSPATGSFSPATCKLLASSNSSTAVCSTRYIPTGTLAVGTYANDISASFSAIGNFPTATATSNLTITGATGISQTITVTPPPGTQYAGTSVLLGGTASSGLPVSFSVVSGPAYITGSTLTYTAAGTVVVEADQAGNATYAPAPPVQITLLPILLTEPVGTASVVINTVLTFTASGTFTNIKVLTQGMPNLDFQIATGGTVNGGLCAIGITYSAGQICKLGFLFKPTRPGLRYGGISITDASGTVLANSLIYGMGVGPMVTYSPGKQGTAGTGLIQPTGVTVDGHGDIFVSGYGAVGVQEISSAGVITTLGQFDTVDDLAVDGLGNVFVASNRTTVSEILAVNGTIPANPTIVTLATSFVSLNGIKVDANGDVFLANGDSSGTTGAIYEIPAVNGVIPATPTINTVYAFQGGPTGVAIDAAGDVFYSDGVNQSVNEILAVNGLIPASPTVLTLGSGFGQLANIALDDADNVFTVDYTNHVVWELLAVNGSIPATNPTLRKLGTGLSVPSGVFIDGAGTVYVADETIPSIVTIDTIDPPVLNFATTFVGSTSADSPRTVTVFNDGNAPLLYTIPGAGPNPTITPGFTLGASSTCPQLTSGSATATLPAGTSCTDLVSFTPIAVGLNSGKLITTDNNLNVAAATQTVLLNGTGKVIPPAAITLNASPNPVFLYNPVAITATVSSAAGTPTGTVQLLDGTTPLGTFTLSSGVATLTTSTLTLGSHNITAIYSGDSTYATQTSSILVVLVEDFSFVITNPTLTIKHGGTAVFNFVLTTVGGTNMAADIGFTIAGSPDHSPVTFNPTSVLTGSGTTTGTITIVTPDYPVGPFSSIADPRAGPRIVLGLTLFGVFLLPFGRRRKINKRIAHLSTLLFFLAALTSLTTITGCADTWGPQHYPITVTATSGALSHAKNATLTSQP